MKKVIVFFFIVFISLIFALTIKGNFGNPSPADIYNNMRVMGQPFELSPERGRYALTMSLAQDHSFYLRQDIAKIVTPDLGFYKGKYMILVSPGISMLGVPFYIIGSWLNMAQVFAFAMPAFFGILCFLLIIKICEQLKISFRSAILAGLSYLFATTSFAYSVSYYQHQTTAFLLLAVTTLLFAKRNVFRLGIAAFLVGFSFWVDSQNPIFFIPLTIFAIGNIIEFRNSSNITKISIDIKFLLAGIGIVFAIAAYSVYSILVFHTPFKLSGTLTSVKDFDQDNQPVIKTLAEKKDTSKFFNTRRITHGFATLVINDDRGVLNYAPIILVGFFGIKQLLKKEKEKTIALAGSILFIFVLYTMWGDPYGGWAFGPRYLVPLFALASIFIAQGLDNFKKNILFKLAFLGLFIYGVAVNLLGALTTNEVPPQIEAVPLGMKWNYFLNLDLFRHGLTSSFSYKTYLSHVISLQVFASTIFILIITAAISVLFIPRRKK